MNTTATPVRNRKLLSLTVGLLVLSVVAGMSADSLLIPIGGPCSITNSDTCNAYRNVIGNRMYVVTDRAGVFQIEGQRLYIVNRSRLDRVFGFTYDRHGGRVRVDATNPKSGFDPLLRQEGGTWTFRVPTVRSRGEFEEVALRP
jgi:hypothetical protein